MAGVKIIAPLQSLGMSDHMYGTNVPHTVLPIHVISILPEGGSVYLQLQSTKTSLACMLVAPF